MIILYIIAFHYTVMYSFIVHTSTLVDNLQIFLKSYVAETNMKHLKPDIYMSALCCCFVFSNKVILCVLYLTD